MSLKIGHPKIDCSGGRNSVTGISVAGGHIPFDGVAPREYVEYLIGRYAVLGDRYDYLRLTLYLTLSPYVDDRRARGRNAIPVEYNLLGTIIGAPTSARHGNLKSGVYLDGYRAAMEAASVDHEEPFTFKVLPPASGYCRAVCFERLPDSVLHRALAAATAPPGDDVWVTTSDILVPSSATRRHIRETAKVTGAPPGDAPKLVRELISYLHALPPNTFSPLARPAVVRSAWEYARSLYAPSGRTYVDPSQRARFAAATSALAAVELQPKPFYLTSTATPRIHTQGHSLATLPRRVRQFLTREVDWAEFDLAHAQLAINAALWDVGEVLSRLESDEAEVWAELITHVGVPPSFASEYPEAYRTVKSAIKATLCGVCFGMRTTNIRRFGNDHIYDKESSPDEDVIHGRRAIESATGLPIEEAGDRFLRHPIVTSMLTASNRRLENIRRKGFGTDYFERRVHIRNASRGRRAVNERSVLAQIAQAMEFALLQPVIEAAMDEERKRREGKQPAWTITLWQHDGFTVRVQDRRRLDNVTRELKRLVAERASRLSIPTQLRREVPEEPLGAR